MTELQHRYALDFYLIGDVSEDLVMRTLLFVQRLGKKGRWPAGRPQFVDELDEDSATQPEDLPIRTVGAVVPLRDPRTGISAREDSQDLEAVRRVVEGLRAFTAALGLTVELQLGGVYAGRIANGHADHLVEVGLISEWEKSVAERSPK